MVLSCFFSLPRKWNGNVGVRRPGGVEVYRSYVILNGTAAPLYL